MTNSTHNKSFIDNEKSLHVEQVMGIFPNSIGFGFAYFPEQTLLSHYGVKRISPATNERAMQEIKKLIETYQPSVVVLPAKDGKFNRKRSRVQRLIALVKHYAEEHGIMIKHYSRKDIRLVFKDFNAKSKNEIALQIGMFFPFLKNDVPPKPRAFDPEHYRQGMFDAISLAITHNDTENQADFM